MYLKNIIGFSSIIFFSIIILSKHHSKLNAFINYYFFLKGDDSMAWYEYRGTTNDKVIPINTTATAEDIATGKTVYSNGEKIVGNIPSIGIKTYSPGKANITIPKNYYLDGNQTIKGDSNLIAANIVVGKKIFGVTGTVRCVTYRTNAKNYTTSTDKCGEIYNSVTIPYINDTMLFAYPSETQISNGTYSSGQNLFLSSLGSYMWYTISWYYHYNSVYQKAKYLLYDHTLSTVTAIYGNHLVKFFQYVHYNSNNETSYESISMYHSSVSFSSNYISMIMSADDKYVYISDVGTPSSTTIYMGNNNSGSSKNITLTNRIPYTLCRPYYEEEKNLLFHKRIYLTGSDSANGVYYSYDGKTWTKTSITSGQFNMSANIKSRLAFISVGSTLYYSYDGISWTQFSNTVAMGSCQKFVSGTNSGPTMNAAIGSGGNEGLLCISPFYDLTYGGEIQSTAITTGNFHYLASSGDYLIAASSDDGTPIYYSYNGYSWAQYGTMTSPVKCLEYANEKFVLATTDEIYISNERCLGWSKISIADSTIGFDFVFYGTNNVWVGGYKTLNYVHYSTDNGTTWTKSNEISGSTGFSAGCYNRFTQLYLIGSSSGNGIYYSKDGISWYQTELTAQTVNKFMVTNTNVVALTGTGLYYSHDGISWNITNLTNGIYTKMSYIDVLQRPVIDYDVLYVSTGSSDNTNNGVCMIAGYNGYNGSSSGSIIWSITENSSTYGAIIDIITDIDNQYIFGLSKNGYLVVYNIRSRTCVAKLVDSGGEMCRISYNAGIIAVAYMANSTNAIVKTFILDYENTDGIKNLIIKDFTSITIASSASDNPPKIKGLTIDNEGLIKLGLSNGYISANYIRTGELYKQNTLSSSDPITGSLPTLNETGDIIGTKYFISSYSAY